MSGRRSPVLPRLEAAAIAESAMILREISHVKEAGELLKRADGLGMSGEHTPNGCFFMRVWETSKGWRPQCIKRLRGCAHPSDQLSLAVRDILSMKNGLRRHRPGGAHDKKSIKFLLKYF